MKTVFAGIAAFAMVAFAPIVANAQNVVGETPPHPLDGAFAKRADNSITNGILNNPLFQRAVAEAERTYREVEEMRRRNPRIIGASPAHAARATFLRVINGDAEIGSLQSSTRR